VDIALGSGRREEWWWAAPQRNANAPVSLDKRFLWWSAVSEKNTASGAGDALSRHRFSQWLTD